MTGRSIPDCAAYNVWIRKCTRGERNLTDGKDVLDVMVCLRLSVCVRLSAFDVYGVLYFELHAFICMHARSNLKTIFHYLYAVC